MYKLSISILLFFKVKRNNIETKRILFYSMIEMSNIKCFQVKEDFYILAFYLRIIFYPHLQLNTLQLNKEKRRISDNNSKASEELHNQGLVLWNIY